MAGPAAPGAALERLAARLWWTPHPTWLARCLTPLAWLYAALALLARAPYRLGWRQAQHAPVPVVVVGNLIAGGAGKTPTVIAVVELLRGAGWRPGVVSRGYGRTAGGILEVRPGADARDVGDEPLLIGRRTGAPVWVGRRRADVARALCAAHPEVDVLVSDDGLQHHALARDAEVIVFDERGVGNGLRLPAGPLREALPADLAASTLVLYNAAAPTTRLAGSVATRRLGPAVPLADWWAGRTAHAVPLAELQAQLTGALLAVAGVAAPERFFSMLESEGLLIERLPLPDHHDHHGHHGHPGHPGHTTLPWPPATADVVTTEKDAVKLRPEQVGSTRVWVVGLDFGLPAHFSRALLRCLPPPSPR